MAVHQPNLRVIAQGQRWFTLPRTDGNYATSFYVSRLVPGHLTTNPYCGNSRQHKQQVKGWEWSAFSLATQPEPHLSLLALYCIQRPLN